MPRGHRSSPELDLPQRDLARRTELRDLLASVCMTSRWSPNPRSLYRRAELRSRGIHPRRLASDEFVEVIPGFLTPSRAPAVLALSARLLQREVAPSAVISHCTAAELLDVPLPRALEYATCKVIHCTLTPPERRHSGRGAVFHSRPTSATTSVQGVRVSGPLDLLVQLAEQLEHDDLVAAADQLVGPNSRVRPRPRLEHLRDRARKARNTYRIRKVRSALVDARERVESPKETQTRLTLLRAGFAEPVINLPVRAPRSGERFRIDLAYPSLRIAIEYDGFWHSTDKKRHAADRRKDDVLHEMGWRVVRASDEDLREPGDFLGRLRHLNAPMPRGRALGACAGPRGAGAGRSAPPRQPESLEPLCSRSGTQRPKTIQ